MGVIIRLHPRVTEPVPTATVDPLDLIVDLQQLLKWAPADVIADVIVYAKARAAAERSA